MFIALHNLSLFAYHGIHPEERILGAWYIINIKVGIADKEIKTIADTIDYAALLNMTKERFANPTPLLETIVWDLYQLFLNRFKLMEYVFISIQKKNPPLGITCESSEVILEKKLY
ncbi:MAG: dihydroneopterin aldolase [Chitinophagaceae bacterium]